MYGSPPFTTRQSGGPAWPGLPFERERERERERESEGVLVSPLILAVLNRIYDRGY